MAENCVFVEIQCVFISNLDLQAVLSTCCHGYWKSDRIKSLEMSDFFFYCNMLLQIFRIYYSWWQFFKNIFFDNFIFQTLNINCNEPGQLPGIGSFGFLPMLPLDLLHIPFHFPSFSIMNGIWGIIGKKILGKNLN